jgi:hypothetical protein
MRFVLVRGRTPFSQTHCACCNQPISAGYLRAPPSLQTVYPHFAAARKDGGSLG